MLPVLLVSLGLTSANPPVVSIGSVPESLAMAYGGIVAIGQGLVWAAVAVAFDWLRRRHGPNVTTSVDSRNPSE